MQSLSEFIIEAKAHKLDAELLRKWNNPNNIKPIGKKRLNYDKFVDFIKEGLKIPYQYSEDKFTNSYYESISAEPFDKRLTITVRLETGKTYGGEYEFNETYELKARPYNDAYMYEGEKRLFDELPNQMSFLNKLINIIGCYINQYEIKPPMEIDLNIIQWLE